MDYVTIFGSMLNKLKLLTVHDMAVRGEEVSVFNAGDTNTAWNT